MACKVPTGARLAQMAFFGSSRIGAFRGLRVGDLRGDWLEANKDKLLSDTFKLILIRDMAKGDETIREQEEKQKRGEEEKKKGGCRTSNVGDFQSWRGAG